MEVTRPDDLVNENVKPNNNLTLAIVATILGICSPFCIGLILGIVSIVMATQVDTKFNMGDIDGAVKSAKIAKILALIAIGLFVLSIAITAFNIMYYGLDTYLEQYQEIINAAQGGA